MRPRTGNGVVVCSQVRINSSFLTKPGGDTVQDECPMRRSQPASQDSEDADTVATADCSRWRNGVERQARPDAHAHQVAAVGGSSTDGVRRVRARTAPRMTSVYIFKKCRHTHIFYTRCTTTQFTVTHTHTRDKTQKTVCLDRAHTEVRD